MKVFFDSDVLLDLFIESRGFQKNAGLLFSLCEKKKMRGYTSPVVIANIYYVLKRENNLGREKAGEAVKLILQVINVLKTDSEIVSFAFSSSFSDKEDAIQFYTAQKGNIDFLLSRNVADYRLADNPPVITPSDFLETQKIRSILARM